MFITKSKYEQLNAEKKALCDEVQRLAEQISAQVTDCKVGPWCAECQHLGHERAMKPLRSDSSLYVAVKGGDVTYCAKHIRSICPEYERESRTEFRG